MYNYSELLGCIIKIYGSQAAFSQAMELSERSVSLKLNNKRDWRQSEIKKACFLLSIPSYDIAKYFFNFDVQD